MMMPIMNPPSAAPTTFPMPPKTAAVKATRPLRKSGLEPVLWVTEAEVDAPGARRRGAEEEGDAGGPVDVDPHRGGGIGILARPPHRDAARLMGININRTIGITFFI